MTVPLDVAADEGEPLLPTQFVPAQPHHVSITSAVLFGYGLMALAALAKATRATLFHVAETVYKFPASVVLLLSAFIFTSLSFIYVLCTGILRNTPLPLFLFLQLVLRGLFAACTLYLDNVALSIIPVGTALTLFSTVPAITSILAALFLNDPLSMADILVLLINMVGVVLVARPSANSDPAFLRGVFAALGASTSAAVGFTLLKKMGSRIHFMLNMLAIGVGCAVFSVLFTPFQHYALLWRAMPSTLVPFAGAAVGFITQALVNRGVQLCRPGPALVVRSFAVPVSFGFGLIFLDERVSFRVIVGVLLVMASVAYIGLSQVWKQHTECKENEPVGKANETEVAQRI